MEEVKEEIEEPKEEVTQEEPIIDDSLKGKDITEDLILKELTEEEKEEKKGIPTEVLNQFTDRIDNIICLIVNKVGKLSDSNKLTPEEVSQTKFSKAVIETIEYYYPEIPVDHPVTGLVLSGAVLGGIVIDKVKAEREGKDDYDTE
jgi:hypothetical protein